MITETKEMIFTMGSPGAGKSYTAKKLYPSIERLDCDEIKKQHPNYDPKNPGSVHDWSSVELSKQVAQAMLGDSSVIVDGTGANSEKLVRWITEARANGFRTKLLFVTCSLKTALERNASRERSVPAWLVAEKFKDVAFSFQIVAPHADEVLTINNEN